MSARLAISERKPIRRFSREWYYGAVRTAVWVVVITVLIWVYADLQFTDERDVRVTLRIHADSAGGLVLLSPAEEFTVNFRVKGYRVSIDSFLSRLASLDWKLQHDAARDFEPGRPHAERVAEMLANLPEVRDAGLQVLWARPRDVELHLDELKRLKSVPVTFVATGGQAVEPKLEPDRVDLLVPASKWGEIDPSKLVLQTRPFDLSRYDVDTEIKNAPVEILPPPGIGGVRLVRPTVRVSFKVGYQAEKEFTVPIDVKMPRAWADDGTWSKYALRVQSPETWTRRVKAVGDRIDLDRLKQEDIKAYVELKEVAKDIASWEFGQVNVILPSRLKVRLSRDPIPPVGYRLETRAAAGPP